MGLTLKRLARSFWGGAVVASFLGLLGSEDSNSQTLYNITFSQFSAGSAYTNASGPPNDFSSYVTSGSNASGVSSYILPVFTINLTNQPLVCNNPGQGVGNFLMQMGSASSNAVALNMQLQLDSTVGAAVAFGQSGSPGSNVTSITLSFPDAATNTVQVQSVDGPTGSPTVLYSFSTGLVRSNLQNIGFSLNLPAHTFSLIVNGVSFASNAPIGFARPITQAGISIGDINNLGIAGAGNGGIDNIVLTAGPAVSISDIFFSGTNVMVGLITSTNAHYDVQTTTSLVSPAWSTIYSNVLGIEGLTNFNCGASASSQQFYRAVAHP
jgi:hypothetical protein